MKALLLSLALLLPMAAAGPDEAAVRGAVESFNKAAHSGDRATLDKLLAPSIVYGHSTARIENKTEAVDALVKTKPRFEWQGNWDVMVYGNSAVVHGRAIAHNMADGKATQVPLDILQVWVKQGKAWTMVARHTTRLTQ